MFGLLLAAVISAPACYPGEAPCTRAYTAHYSDGTGMCVKWFKPTTDDWEPLGYCFFYKSIAPDEQGSISDLWFTPLSKAARDSLFSKQVGRELTPVELETWTTLDVNKPLSLWAVPGTPENPTARRVYFVAADKRVLPHIGTIPVGSPCYPSVWQSGIFAAVNKVQPMRVALCSKR